MPTKSVVAITTKIHPRTPASKAGLSTLEGGGVHDWLSAPRRCHDGHAYPVVIGMRTRVGPPNVPVSDARTIINCGAVAFHGLLAAANSVRRHAALQDGLFE